MMAQTMRLWIREVRAPFLVLPVVLVGIGGAAGYHDGVFHPGRFLLTLAGVVLAHASVNLFNEYSDWRTGIDARTERTPFSGGAGNMQQGLLDPLKVRLAAWGTLFVAGIIGIILTGSVGWPVLAMMLAGGIAAVWYTDVFARMMIGEVLSGICLGSLVVIGAYFVQTGRFTPGIVWASVPPGLLTMLLLFLNEFPDAEADRAGGRRHLVIVFGKHRSAILYAALLAVMYGIIPAGVVEGMLPRGALLGLLTLPLAVAAVVRTLRYHDDTPRLVPALGMNVLVVLVTDLLLAIGYLVS